jgi:hypothetical protein
MATKKPSGKKRLKTKSAKKLTPTKPLKLWIQGMPGE